MRERKPPKGAKHGITEQTLYAAEATEFLELDNGGIHGRIDGLQDGRQLVQFPRL